MYTTPSSGAFLCARIFPQVIYLCKFLFVKTKIKWENHNAGPNTVPGLSMLDIFASSFVPLLGKICAIPWPFLNLEKLAFSYLTSHVLVPIWRLIQ